MRFLHLIVLLFLSWMLSSCEEDFVLVKNDFKPQIVINSIFKPDHKWVVHVSTSRDMLDRGSQIKNVENANVVIIEKLSKYKVYLDYKGDGVYSADYYPPRPDKTYELYVEVPGYKTIRAESIAPKKANIVNISKDFVDKKISSVNFEVKDDSNKYLIWNFITSRNGNNPVDTIYTGSPKSFIYGFFNYNDALSGFSNKGNDAVSSDGTFSSNIIDSDDIGGKDNSGQNHNGSGNSEAYVVKKYLRVVTASNTLYSYYKSVEQFLSASNHNSSFSNNPKIYSNIENGLGIFAGYTEQLTEIE